MSDFNVSKITPEFKKISVFSNNETDSLFGAGDVTFDIFSSGLSNLGITSNKDQSNLWNFLNANVG